MMKTGHHPILTGIDVLGLTLLVSVVFGSVAPGAVPESLSGSLRHVLVPAQNIQTDASDQADCLWLQARNHGFYDIQHQAVAGKATADADRLWQAFLDSTGAHECGSPLTDLAELMPALLASLPEADRHFMNPTDNRHQ